MFDPRMLVLRMGSAAAIFYGASEFMRDPQNLEEVLAGSSEIWEEVYDWGQNKFMGIASNDTALQVKKSARQIYAEAFMEEDQWGASSTQFATYADDDAVKEAYEKQLADAAAAEEIAERDADEEEAENREEKAEEKVVLKGFENVDDALEKR